MHEATYDFLVVHIKASQKSLGDKPKSVYIFLQTPTKFTQGNLIYILIVLIALSRFNRVSTRRLRFEEETDHA